MSKKKKNKNKVAKLTDEQYSNYIMALKDEVPPALIKETEEYDQWTDPISIYGNYL